MKTVMVAVINAPYDAVLAVNKEVAIRKVLNLNVTLDHRFVDGSFAPNAVGAIMKVVNNIESYL